MLFWYRQSCLCLLEPFCPLFLNEPGTLWKSVIFWACSKFRFLSASFTMHLAWLDLDCKYITKTQFKFQMRLVKTSLRLQPLVGKMTLGNVSKMTFSGFFFWTRKIIFPGHNHSPNQNSLVVLAKMAALSPPICLQLSLSQTKEQSR